MALMRLEREVFALWCRWLFRPLDDAGEQRAREAFEAAMAAVDDALGRVGGGGPFFLGENISLVDLIFVPFLERQNASLLYWKGFKLRNGGWANIDRYVHAASLPACSAGELCCPSSISCRPTWLQTRSRVSAWAPALLHHLQVGRCVATSDTLAADADMQVLRSPGGA